jgi:2,3-bisphosphoglycerate-dependent phosphoglycerate mutase
VGLTLYLVRHGETEWNAQRRVQGHMDVPLNARGRGQAAAAAAELAGQPLGAVIASDLSRAIDTAAPIAAAHGLEVQIEQLLRERDFGRAEGRFDADLELEYGEQLLSYWRDPDAPFPEGESIREHQQRVSGYLEQLLADPPAEAIALVSHGGTVRRALNHLAGIPVEARLYAPIANGSIHTVEVPAVAAAPRDQ